MFSKDFFFYGRHATYAKYLRDEVNLLNSIYDVYMLSAILGFLHNKKGVEDKSSNDQIKIGHDTFRNHKDECLFLYNILSLLVNKNKINTSKDIEDIINSNSYFSINVFNEYVYGGLNWLFEKVINGYNHNDELIDKVYFNINEFIEDNLLTEEDLENRLIS